MSDRVGFSLDNEAAVIWDALEEEINKQFDSKSAWFKHVLKEFAASSPAEIQLELVKLKEEQLHDELDDLKDRREQLETAAEKRKKKREKKQEKRSKKEQLRQKRNKLNRLQDQYGCSEDEYVGRMKKKWDERGHDYGEDEVDMQRERYRKKQKEIKQLKTEIIQLQDMIPEVEA